MAVFAATMTVHLLLQIEPGRAAEAVDYLSEVPDIAGAVPTTGAYDVIASVPVVSDLAMSRALAAARRTPGLWALRVCRPTAREASPAAS